ncbi:butyrophilin subfamily 3 member A2-like [Clinocottus analis]|uniref:butyrophilin subfamily 3 member A2-like n=1 Tax=Clinocottus analis TaxID=304258 RepID=UPI0035BEFB4C
MLSDEEMEGQDSGQPQVIGTSQPIVAMVGDDISLPCHLKTAVDATGLTVEWRRPDLEPSFVLLRRDGVQLQLEDNPLLGRTSLSTQKLKCGDISMTLSQVKLSDAGTYKCLVSKSETESVVELTVGSVSSPLVEISKSSVGVVLRCESGGWYPKPELLWLDAEGNLFSAGAPESVRGPDDLYTVSSRVTVEQRHSNSFTCRVHQRTTKQTRDTHIRLSANLFGVQASSVIRIIICSLVSIVLVVAVVLVVWKQGRNIKQTTNDSIELQHLMEEGDAEKLMTCLDKTKAKLNEELENKEVELRYVQEVITTLTSQKNNLKNQRKQLISQQQENKTQITEINKKINKNPNPMTGGKKKKREEKLNDLKRSDEELKELLENTDNLQESTDGMIIKMTEWKGKQERDREKINTLLKNNASRREEIQKELEEQEKLQKQSEREEEIKPPIPTA